MEDKILELINQSQAFVLSMAEPTFELIMVAVRVELAGNILVSLGFLLVAFIIYHIAWPVANKFDSEYDKNATKLLCSLPISILFLLALLRLLEIWNYVGLIYPEAYLMHQVIEGITK